MLATGLALASFLASNLDNFFLMTVLRATGVGTGRIVAGFVTAVALVLAAAIGGGWLLGGLSPRVTGWLGLVPLSLGVAAFLRSRTGSGEDESAVPASVPGFLGVTTLMLATSGDAVALFTASFADTDARFWTVMVVATLAAAALWSGLAARIGSAVGDSTRLMRYSSALVPAIMVAIGAYILFDSPTDLL